MYYQELEQTIADIDKLTSGKLQIVQKKLLEKYVECVEANGECKKYSQMLDPLSAELQLMKQQYFSCLQNNNFQDCLKSFKINCVKKIDENLSNLEKKLEKKQFI